MKLSHGGDLTAAAKQYGRPVDEWLDLSTGISPWPYPVPTIPQSIWQRLPYDNDNLVDAAAAYYQVPANHITPIPGSQYAITHLPRLLAKSSVAIPAVGYREHERAWRITGHTVFFYESWEQLNTLVAQGEVTHVIILHPNNPNGDLLPHATFESLLSHVSGYCFIDEAFMDLNPEKSFVTSLASYNNVFILRSVGKFFGLAGLRLGFLLGEGDLIERLRSTLDPWGVNNLALFVGQQALSDNTWQKKQREGIQQQSQSIYQLLASRLQDHSAATTLINVGLFLTIMGEKDFLAHLYECAARQGVLLRYNSLPQDLAWLRFGLPGEHEPTLHRVVQELVV